VEITVAPLVIVELLDSIDRLLADYAQRSLLDSRAVCDDLLDLRILIGVG